MYVEASVKEIVPNPRWNSQKTMVIASLIARPEKEK
jgi:hypothetical protein